ncbi:MAG: MOSC domain-containing protein [Actinomycetota bacterium]|nr:MOSC domain-containing protein [Actinomycetota bacterium]
MHQPISGLSSPGALGRLIALWRYPVKSMGGEALASAELTADGVLGDRRWAAYTADGGMGSGKNTRRFRRVDGLLDLRTELQDPSTVPEVVFPDGRRGRADDPGISQALSDLLDRPLQLRPQTVVPHHDESPVHLVTTASLRQLESIHVRAVAAARFRANILLELDQALVVGRLPGREWEGRRIRIGTSAVLRMGPSMSRCVMVNAAQPVEGLPTDGALLKTLGSAGELEFGDHATVVCPGRVSVGDEVTLL